jgi:hypothetical protein
VTEDLVFDLSLQENKVIARLLETNYSGNDLFMLTKADRQVARNMIFQQYLWNFANLTLRLLDRNYTAPSAS